MFKLKNLYNNSQLELEVDYDNTSIVFDISSIVNKRNKDEINAEKQFIILEAYLDYKGDKFKKALLEEYILAEEILLSTIGSMDVINLPYDLVNGIFKLFDFEDVFHFIKHVYKLKPLPSLKDKFDDKMVEDGLGTRVQTYIKDDYLELVALVQILKTVVGPIGHFGYINSMELGKDHIHYSLFNFFIQNDVYETRPFVKLLGLVDKVIENVSRNAEEAAIRIIEKKMPSNDLNHWALSSAIIQKIAMAVILEDNDLKNVVTRTYNFVNNKLQNKGDTSNSIRPKRTMLDSEVGDSDPESVLESYRIVSELPKGFVVEMEWAIDNISKTMLYGSEYINSTILYKARAFTERLKDITLTPVQISILGWIFKDYIDPRSLMYVKIDAIVDLIALAFTKLWNMGYKDLALLISSMPVEYDDAEIINFTTNRKRISKEMKLELDEVFPYKKIIVSTGGNREVNVAESSINLISDDFYKHRWMYSADNEYIEEVNNNTSKSAEVPGDLKTRLAELILHINRR